MIVQAVMLSAGVDGFKEAEMYSMMDMNCTVINRTSESCKAHGRGATIRWTGETINYYVTSTYCGNTTLESVGDKCQRTSNGHRGWKTVSYNVNYYADIGETRDCYIENCYSKEFRWEPPVKEEGLVTMIVVSSLILFTGVCFAVVWPIGYIRYHRR